MDKIKTYIEGLDERMEMGIPPKHIVLVCGTSGTMKSSVAFNIIYNYAKEKNGKSLYFSLEQNRDSLVKHMAKLGMDVSTIESNITIMDFSWMRRELKEIEDTEGIDWLESIQFQIKNYKEKTNYDILVLDSLAAVYAVGDLKNPRSDLFHFFEFLREMNITAFLISEMEEDSKSYGVHGVESFLADGIIHLNMERTGRSVGRFINVVKMREVKHATDYFPLLVDEGGFKIVKK
jgi:KaiC/GvpD/RAD55 family RecA-like ATPase